MLPLNEIQKLKVNPNVAKMLLDQCEKRLTSIIETGDVLEKKSITLFNMYFVVITAIASANQLFSYTLTVSLIITISTLVAGVVFLVINLFPLRYGRLGVAPADWLREDVLTADDEGLTHFIIYYTAFYDKRIANSERSNHIKLWLFYAGAGCGVAAVIVAVAGTMI